MSVSSCIPLSPPTPEPLANPPQMHQSQSRTTQKLADINQTNKKKHAVSIDQMPAVASKKLSEALEINS